MLWDDDGAGEPPEVFDFESCFSSPESSDEDELVSSSPKKNLGLRLPAAAESVEAVEGATPAERGAAAAAATVAAL